MPYPIQNKIDQTREQDRERENLETPLDKKIDDTLASDTAVKKSLVDTRQWFREKINQVLYPTNRVVGIRERPKSFYDNNLERRIFRASQIAPGSLYCWFYEPKYRRTLPYYDAFPVAFILNMYNDGFLGINMHYLPLRARATLLTRLLDNMLRKTSTGTYLDLQYATLNQAAKFREFKPCIKRYLINFIRGQMIVIPPDEWIKTVFLPLESFQKRNSSFVWRDSIRISRGL